MMSLPWMRKMALMIVGAACACGASSGTAHANWGHGRSGGLVWPVWTTTVGGGTVGGGTLVGGGMVGGGTLVGSGTITPGAPAALAPGFGYYYYAPTTLAPTVLSPSLTTPTLAPAAPGVAQMSPYSYLTSPASQGTRQQLVNELWAEAAGRTEPRERLGPQLLGLGRGLLKRWIGGWNPRPEDDTEIQRLVDTVLNQKFGAGGGPAAGGGGDPSGSGVLGTPLSPAPAGAPGLQEIRLFRDPATDKIFFVPVSQGDMAPAPPAAPEEAPPAPPAPAGRRRRGLPVDEEAPPAPPAPAEPAPAPEGDEPEPPAT